MLRISFVAHWDWVLFRFQLPLAVALRDAGCEVVLVCPRGEFVDRLEAAGFRCKHWSVRRRSCNPLHELMAMCSLGQILRQLKPDIVQNFTIKPNLYGTVCARLLGVPVVINTFTGLGYLFSQGKKARRLRAALYPAFRWAFQAPNVYAIVLSEEDRRILRWLGLVGHDRTVVVTGSGVDTVHFRPTDRVWNTGRGPVILLAARLLWDKGVGEFVDAARLLLARGVKAEFWVAGRPDQGNPACIPEEVLERWRREGAASFLGHRDDMRGLLHRVHVGVLPSYHEGIPTFLSEAAASGLPLVATRVKGCKEVVEDGVNGFLVPPRDPEALAEAIGRLISKPDLRRQMGRESRKKAESRFDVRIVVEQQLELYRRLGLGGTAVSREGVPTAGN